MFSTRRASAAWGGLVGWVRGCWAAWGVGGGGGDDASVGEGAKLSLSVIL